MRLLRTVLASACILGMAAGGAVSVHAQPYYPPHPWHHPDWRARRAWRWHHEHAYVAPAPGPYAYYVPPAPPPVYYAPPGGVTLGVTIP